MGGTLRWSAREVVGRERVPHIEMTIETDLAPELIRSALLDFTPNRPERWPGLSADEYKVYTVGDTWAEIREGNGGAIWARERYDWSDPETVVWTVLESGFSTPGSFVSARITPPDGQPGPCRLGPPRGEPHRSRGDGRHLGH